MSSTPTHLRCARLNEWQDLLVEELEVALSDGKDFESVQLASLAYLARGQSGRN
jgi:hypothetical protein